ncbi:peptide ABC transporter substrate-binding protein [Sporosarcina gallistercoris]|uniref:Peptide ABC transporter substrate-binding protein n=1 Tax=Sporosarcina gallistercoris TaxID=2762245 RepID=A0ABR8PLL3_9BACL|nr:peptide ABC transporter substrate-binding protein [Sporosarcina gallistercoris]MBD7909060.1 peptide ABC transporter substrate-binding protein [Sporosarcina gallistercoris]
MKKKSLWFYMMIFGSLVLLAGCYGGESTQESAKSGDSPTGGKEEESVLHLAVAGEIPTLKTNGAMDGLSQTMIQNIFEGLFRIDADDKVSEGLVETYDVSEDGLKYTFHLREDALWSNGEPTKATDFIYAWKKALHPDTVSPHAYLMDAVKGAADIQNPEHDMYGKVDELGVTAPNDFTLEVELNNDVPYFTELLTNPVFYPQNEKFAEEQQDNYALEVENLVFNGPFTLDSWDHDQKWTLKKNEDYWNAEDVKVDEVNFKVAKDTSTEVNLYETDTIDVANLSSEFVDVYKDHEEYTTSLKSEVYFLRMNQKNEFLSNTNIRKAIDMGWDKEQAAESILKNGSKPAYWLVFPDFVESQDGEEFRERYGDLNKGTAEEAKELWNKGLEELGVTEVKLDFLSYDDGQRKSVAEYMKNQLETNLPGLSITINQQPNKQKLALEDALDYDLSYSGWRNDVADPVEFLSVFLSDGAYNWQAFKNDQYDKNVKQAMVDFTDLDKRFAELQDAEQILIGEEAAISPMYQAGSARLIKPHVKGFTAHANSTYSYQWVTIDN